MRNFKYLTNRTLKSRAGDEKGRMRVMVRINSDTAEGDYKCPECDHDGKINQEWKRPFSVKCEKCKFLMRAPKLKGKKK